MVIKRSGNEYTLYTRDGKEVLGRHKRLADAQRQERAIRVSQAKEKKKR